MNDQESRLHGGRCLAFLLCIMGAAQTVHSLCVGDDLGASFWGIALMAVISGYFSRRIYTAVYIYVGRTGARVAHAHGLGARVDEAMHVAWADAVYILVGTCWITAKISLGAGTAAIAFFFHAEIGLLIGGAFTLGSAAAAVLVLPKVSHRFLRI